MKLPKKIYVVTRSEGGIQGREKIEWLEADKDIQGFEDGDKVGIYELVDTKSKRTIHTIE